MCEGQTAVREDHADQTQRILSSQPMLLTLDVTGTGRANLTSRSENARANF